MQVTLLQAGLNRVLVVGAPVAPIPEHHRAAAVLALGDDAFEVAVIQRMGLGLYRQALVVGI
jgi:hypothetical protein